MLSINDLVKVLEYTDEDLKDSSKYNKYVDLLSETIDDVEDSGFKNLLDELLGFDLIDELDDRLCHADEVHDSAEKEACRCTEKALTSPSKCSCKNTCKCHEESSKKYNVEELVNEYLKQSDIQKSFTKPQHYYQALALLTDFAEYVINK